MLLDGQRPFVVPESGAVVLHAEYVTGDGYRNRFVLEQEQKNSEPDERVKRRVNLEAAANQETIEIDRTVPLIVAEEQAGYEETAENEEQVNPSPPDLGPQRKVIVVGSQNHKESESA